MDLEVKHQPKLTRLSPELARASILFFKYAGILTDDFFLLPASGLSGTAFSELLLLILIAPLSGLLFSCFASHSSLFSLQHRPKKTMFVFANICGPVRLYCTLFTHLGRVWQGETTHSWHSDTSRDPEPKRLKYISHYVMHHYYIRTYVRTIFLTQTCSYYCKWPSATPWRLLMIHRYVRT